MGASHSFRAKGRGHRLLWVLGISLRSSFWQPIDQCNLAHLQRVMPTTIWAHTQWLRGRGWSQRPSTKPHVFSSYNKTDSLENGHRFSAYASPMIGRMHQCRMMGTQQHHELEELNLLCGSGATNTVYDRACTQVNDMINADNMFLWHAIETRRDREKRCTATKRDHTGRRAFANTAVALKTAVGALCDIQTEWDTGQARSGDMAKT